MENKTKRYVVAEIMYNKIDPERGYEYLIHSDIGPAYGDLSKGLQKSDFRKFLHDNLDEWLDNSDGTGIFFITGESQKYFKNEL